MNNNTEIQNADQVESKQANMLFMAYDGDNAGRLVGQAILANDSDALHEASDRINHGHQIVADWVTEHGGSVISAGGDQGVFMLPKDAMEEIEELRKDYQFATDLTMTVGVGNDLSEAGRALIAGKFKGKDQVVMYDASVDQALSEAQQKVADGTASEDEQKQTDSYLSEGQEDGDQTEDGEQDQDSNDNEESDPNNQKDPNGDDGEETDEEKGDEALDEQAEEGEEKKEVDDEVADEEASTPDDKSNQEEKTPKSEEKIPKSKDKKEPKEKKSFDKKPMKKGEEEENEEASDEEADPEENQEDKSQPEEDGQEGGEEAIDEVEEGLENPGSEGQERDLMDEIDDVDLAVGHEMEDNISRPEGFDEQNAPGDTGMNQENDDEMPESENDDEMAMEDGQEEGEEPSSGDIFQQGLEDGSSDIQKEKVFQAVAQALEGFKNCQAILEQAKQKAPELYQSTLIMLKAMLEMAKMLGNDPSQMQPEEGGEEMPEQAEEGAEEIPEDPSEDPSEVPADEFEKKSAEELSEREKSKAPAGEKKELEASVGKLPTKKTTKHIARTTMAPGSVNGKGQQKIIDPTTGKTRWVDRKKGSVKSNTGVPIRAPKPGKE